jgi:hypothetical protein
MEDVMSYYPYLYEELNEERIDLLEGLENLRWKIYLNLQGIQNTVWHETFEEVAKHKAIWGFMEDGKKYLVTCNDGQGYTGYFVDIQLCTKEYFIACLEDEEIPIHVNHPSEDFRNVLNKFIDGEIPRIRRDDEWIKRFRRLESVMARRRGIMEKILNIIRNHMSKILNMECRKQPEKSYLFTTLRICLTINGRQYIYQNSNFILLPEYEETMVKHTVQSYKEEYNPWHLKWSK